jgi:hypothetical protein
VEDAFAFVRAALPIEARAFHEVELAAYQGLEPLRLCGAVEFDGAVQIAMIGEGQGGHSQLRRAVHQPVYAAGSVEQAVVAVNVKMDEIFIDRWQGNLTKAAGPQEQVISD